MLKLDATVNRHVVNTLLGLVLNHVKKVLGVHIFDVAAEFF